MTSRYILDAVERMKLPISVRIDRMARTRGEVVWYIDAPDGRHIAYRTSHARMAYLDIVSCLQSDPVEASPTGTAADSSSSPLGVS